LKRWIFILKTEYGFNKTLINKLIGMKNPASNIGQTIIANSLFWLIFAGVITSFMASSCKTMHNAATSSQEVDLVKNDTLPERDSTEYELIVMDSKFESWLISQPPAHYYSQQYYENWNQQYVAEWNSRHNNPTRYGNFYQTKIDYNPHIDYGLELNYKLYYYFRFIKKEYDIVLIQRGR
jgi:hypothetical protein